MAATENLNDIPFELKPLTPFLQRAQELKAKDPTMSYWWRRWSVAAVTLGYPPPAISNWTGICPSIPLPPSTVSHMVPSAVHEHSTHLHGVMIRSDPGSVVITSNESACSYIEDFALRVFDAADNEDRRGDATRGTAKKFLAAANFLELLKVFEESPPTPPTGASGSKPNEFSAISAFSRHKDKIRYAKWKAADIAKAFREGRRPVPGPANAPESMRRGVTPLGSPALEPIYDPGPGPVGPYDLVPTGASGFSAGQQQPSQFSRAPSSNTSSNAVSPIPGTSRNASLSPGKRNSLLPFPEHYRDPSGKPLEANGINGRGSVFSPTNGPPSVLNGNGYGSTIKTPMMSANQQLVREGGPSNPTTPSKSSFNNITNTHAQRPRSLSQSYYGSGPMGRPAPQIPPKDYMSLMTPMKNMLSPGDPNSLLTPTNQPYTPPAGQVAVSPGSWSTLATPGYDDTRRSGGTPSATNTRFVDQPSPSRIPDNMKKFDDAADQSAYPPHPYPAAAQGHSNGRPASHMGTPGASAREAALARLASIPHEPNSNAKASDEAPENDKVGPLPGSPPDANKPQQKRVRWTPSVIGGNSTVASSSPSSSPRSPLGDLPALPETSETKVNGTNVVTPQMAGGDQLVARLKNGYKGSPPPAPAPYLSPQVSAKTSPPQVSSPPLLPSGAPASPHLAAVNGGKRSPPTVMPKNLPSDYKTLCERENGTPRGSAFNSHNPTPTASSFPTTSSTLSNGSNSSGSSQPFLPPGTLTPFPSVPNGVSPPASAPLTPLATGSSVSSQPPQINEPSRRRVSSASLPATAPPAPAPGIKPFVPLFPAPGGYPNGTANSSPSGSTILSDTSTAVQKTPSHSPPNKTVSPPPTLPQRAASPPKPLPTSLPFRQINAAKKHSKFAASALEFDDLETARAELLAALAILNGERSE
ncbi:hypothetical protein FRB99_007386 [Tulasnella sp. 403]|nr:hypothetical protein FRB99_007386 [Tulasnella sp. 403]